MYESGVRGAAAGFALVLLAVAGCDRPPDHVEPGGVELPPGACTADAPGLAGAWARVDAMLVARLEDEEIPGLAAGVVCGDSLSWAKGYGVMALDDPEPVTPETPFRIASITKVFTATAVLRLQEAGALALDDPVDAHLSWFQIGRPPATGNAPVTIRQLLAHTAGLPRDSRLTNFRRLFQPAREEAIAALPSQSLDAPPGERIAYSNLGYAILGEVIAQASGMTYAEYLERAILAPLGMTRTLVHPTEYARTAWGHGPRRPNRVRSRAGFWALRFATPAGGMASSVEELSAFMRLQLAPYLPSATPQILSLEALEEMHQVHHVVDPDRGGGGLGWAVEISRGQHLIYHGGELPEQTSFMLLDVRGHVGIIVLTNAQGVDANGMAQEILRIVRSAYLPPGSYPEHAIPPGA